MSSQLLGTIAVVAITSAVAYFTKRELEKRALEKPAREREEMQLRELQGLARRTGYQYVCKQTNDLNFKFVEPIDRGLILPDIATTFVDIQTSAFSDGSLKGFIFHFKHITPLVMFI